MYSDLSLIIILNEGIRGHLSQTRGVAHWLAELTGARITEIKVPDLAGWRRFWQLKVKARSLRNWSIPECEKWLIDSGGRALLDDLALELDLADGKEKGCILLSAGNTPAPFNLALGRTLGVRRAVLMTPSVIGTDPFDFAIIPEHDFPQLTDNVLTTLGAPNCIIPDELEKKGKELIHDFPSGDSASWGVLIGGDTANYSIDPEWIRINIGALLEVSFERGAGLYITTSRRTSKEAERALEEITRDRENVRMNLIASRDSRNPVPGILGLCTRIFCTEDSVSMLSEAVTSGKDIFLLRVRKRRGIRMLLGKMTRLLVDARFLPLSSLWGFYRFEFMRQRLIKKGLMVEMPPEIDKWTEIISADINKSKFEFNEAKRSAEWILKRLNG